ncbi:GTP-binding protein [SAR92 clade bacterium H921]|nr:GTP-binding protein [SAR92 clade bacterium H921]
MTELLNRIEAVPTNIITGFLGVGKTSAILHLLQSKPTNQRWAILVNEFGEIGVDGSLFQDKHSEDGNIFIREVPGGCMCCAAGLPMQVALNQLLARAQPDRLLIEPTGLGHPVEVLDVLTAEHYSKVLSIEKIITLVDARNLSDPRYTENATFNQQIAIADVIVGNKNDLYQYQDRVQLEDYVKSKSQPDTKIVFTEQGQLSLDLLAGVTTASVGSHHSHDHPVGSEQLSFATMPLPESGYIKAVNKAQGFHSIGWRFDSSKVFNRQALFVFLSGVEAIRVKAVFITQSGVFGYNITSDALTEVEMDDCFESRIDIITSDIDSQWEAQLFACL